MLEWYTPETGKIVEENWAIEKSIEKLKFPKVKLFNANQIISILSVILSLSKMY